VKNKRHLLPAVFLIGLLCNHLCACGPEFPNRMLLVADYTLLDAPTMPEFEKRIAHLAKSAGVTFKAVVPEKGDYHTQTAIAKQVDLEKATEKRNRLDAILKRDKIPVEFACYEEGAKAYRQTQYDEAIVQWRRLLKLSKDKRQYRSTWAAFMIGKALQKQEKYADSIAWFAKTRSLAKAGFLDSLGLAASSYGWQGYAACRLGRYDEALELYVAHLATGDPTARNSLVQTARRVLDADENTLNAAASSPVARQLVTAYLLSEFHVWKPWIKRAHSWAHAVDHAGATGFEEAGRIALIAYQGADMELAGKYAGLAGSDDVLAGWVRAKLLLRNGRVQEASDILAKLARKLPHAKDDHARPEYAEKSFYNRAGMELETDPVASRIQAELAILRLSQRQYTEALDALLQGGHWVDAAYVAEYVLTADELKMYVNRVWPIKEASSKQDTSRWMRRQIRHLLARRLTRIGRWKEARSYFPAELQPRLDEYIQAIRDGHNKQLDRLLRGRQLFHAARLARHQGMELLATEVEPVKRGSRADYKTFSRAQPAVALSVYRG